MAKYDSLRKTERNRRIYKYHLRHPELSHEEIGKRYGLKRSSITRIICDQREFA